MNNQKKQTGGPADEKSLRDEFAGLALQALISHPEYQGEMCENAVKEAWLFADAMLRERVK